MHSAYREVGAKSVGQARALACYFIRYCRMISKQNTAMGKYSPIAVFRQTSRFLGDVFSPNFVHGDLDKFLILWAAAFLCVQIRPV